MNSPGIPPAVAPAAPKKKHGWGPYGWLAGIGVAVFLCVFLVCGIAADYFYEEGVNKRAHGMSTPAEMDFTIAIVLNPRHARAYCERGAAISKRYICDEAFDDLSRAIELDPKYALAYYERGMAFVGKREYDKALADLNKAIELDPKHAAAYHYRACVYYTQRRWSDAQADFRRCYEQADSKMQDYTRLNLWAVRSQSGGKAAADEELAAHFEQRGKAADPWPARIANFLLGKGRECDLIAAADSPGLIRESTLAAEADLSDYWIKERLRMDGWYYAGMKRLLAGDKTGAADCFRKCTEMLQQRRVNFHCAKAELKALGL